MNDCRRHRTLVIEAELDGRPAAAHSCDGCREIVPEMIDVVRAGRALARLPIPEARAEAGRRRLLAILAAPGGRGLAVILVLASGFLAAGLAVAGPERRVPIATAVVRVAVTTAGAAAAVAEAGGNRSRPGLVPGSRIPLRADRAIMRSCAKSPACC